MGNDVAKRTGVCISTQLSRFAAEHAMNPYIFNFSWSLLQQKHDVDAFAKKNHLLWALSWLKTNCSEASAHKTHDMDKKLSDNGNIALQENFPSWAG